MTERYKLTALSLLAVITFSISGVAWIQTSKTELPQETALVSMPTTSETAGPAAPPELTKLEAELAAAVNAPEWPVLSPSLEEVMVGPQAPPDVMWCGKNEVDESRCTWGDPNATKTIVTVGNSISMTYVAALRSAIGSNDGWNLVSYGMFGCPFGDAVSLEGLSTLPDGCEGRADEAIAAINRLQPDLVVLSGIQKYDSAARKIKEITAPARYVFLPGAPVDKDVASCYSKVSKPSDCMSTVPSNWGYHEKKLATEFPTQGIFVDSQAWYCYGGFCPSFVGGVPTKLDASHITARYAERLGPVIREAFIHQGILN